MLTSQGEMSVRTMQLEKQYEKTIADSARLLDAEKDRLRRMNQLLLQFEGDSLRYQLDQAIEQLRDQTEMDSERRLQLDEAYKEIVRLDQDVQAASTEIQRLEVSSSSLQVLQRHGLVLTRARASLRVSTMLQMATTPSS